MNNKESVICEFEMNFKKPFFCSFNLSDDDIISVLRKHVMLRFVTASRSENGCGDDIFWSEIGSGFEEPGGTPSRVGGSVWQAPK